MAKRSISVPHPMGRLFTVFLAVVGIGTMTYLFSTLVALLLESDLNTVLRKKRMEKEIARLTGHYIVCGIGRVGTNVAGEWSKTRRQLHGDRKRPCRRWTAGWNTIRTPCTCTMTPPMTMPCAGRASWPRRACLP